MLQSRAGPTLDPCTAGTMAHVASASTPAMATTKTTTPTTGAQSVDHLLHFSAASSSSSPSPSSSSSFFSSFPSSSSSILNASTCTASHLPQASIVTAVLPLRRLGRVLQSGSAFPSFSFSSPSSSSSSFSSFLPFSSSSSRPSSLPSGSMLLFSVATVATMLAMVVSSVDAVPHRPLLRGVTIRNWPYADRSTVNDRYEGFVVDLMTLIAQQAGFDFRLYFSPDGKYGTEYNGHINGMIGEVYWNKADFAIADLTVTDSRKRFVDFTEPFLENQLAAIVRREDATGLSSLEDLVTLSEAHYRGISLDRPLVAYGTYRTGSTYFHLSRSTDPVARQMFAWMSRHPEALVRSAKEGFDRVNAGRYAFIVESTFAEYLTGLYCNLTMLYDTRALYPRQFAIALRKGSPYVALFNKAIRELKATGAIQALKNQYWSNRCSEPKVSSPLPMGTTSTTSTTTSTTTATPTTSSTHPPSTTAKTKVMLVNHGVTYNNHNHNHNHHHHQSGSPYHPPRARAELPSARPMQIEWTSHQPPVRSMPHPKQTPPHNIRHTVKRPNDYEDDVAALYGSGAKQANSTLLLAMAYLLLLSNAIWRLRW